MAPSKIHLARTWSQNSKVTISTQKIENTILQIEDKTEIHENDINIEKIKEMIVSCKTMDELKNIAKEMQDLNLIESQKKELREVYGRKSKEFEDGMSDSQSKAE